MRRLLVLCGVVLGLPVSACETALLSCTFKGSSQLTVCLTGNDLTYAFGKSGAVPDLELTSPLIDGAYTPWNGIGRSIWQVITFRNADHSYEVWQSLDRLGADAAPEHGLNVLRGDRLLMSLTCDAGAAAQPFDSLSDRMAAQGLCWNPETRHWNGAAACPP